MKTNSHNYYLYRHIRLDTNQVFYIGIGCGRRAYTKHSRNKHWQSITNKTSYTIQIMLESFDRNFIVSKEIEFIALYGRKDLGKGTLCNFTDGGEGITNVTESALNKMRLKKLGIPNPFTSGNNSAMKRPERIALQTGGNSWFAKPILDLYTGIFYDCLKDGCKANCLDYVKIKQRVSKGKSLKKRRFIYI